MELLEGIKTRRSFRAFKSTNIPRGVIEGILETASNSPSYSNTQPWEVAVVCGKKKEKLGEILCQLVKTGAIEEPDFQLPGDWPRELHKRAKKHYAGMQKAAGIESANEQENKKLLLSNLQFYGAPYVLFLFMDRTLSFWSMFDLGLFAENIVLAAHSFGLGSCLQAAVAHYPDVVREFLGIPKTRKLILGISIGYPDIKASINAYQSKKISPDKFVYC